MDMKRNLPGDCDIPLERDDVEDISGMGACPQCGHRDRVLAADGEHWAVCDVHRIRWAFEEGPCGEPDLRSPTVEARTREVLACYAEAPEHRERRPEVTDEIRWALDLVLDYLWDDESRSYDAATPVERQRHLFRCLHTLDCWLKGQEPFVTLDPFAFGFHWFSSSGRTLTSTRESVGRTDPDVEAVFGNGRDGL